MVELPTWFILSFDFGFALLEAVAFAVAVWALVDTVRDLRQLRLPECLKALGPRLWRRMQIQRRGDLLGIALATYSLLGFALLGAVSGVAAGITMARRHTSEVRTSLAGVGLDCLFVSFAVAVGGIVLVRVLTRIQVRGAMEEFAEKP